MSISGDRIKRLREEKGWSQLELSKRTGINNSVLSRIESGKRPVEETEINIFADTFEVSGDYILGRSIARTPSGGHAYADGGAGWTQEEKDAAAAYIEMLRQQKKARAEREQGN